MGAKYDLPGGMVPLRRGGRGPNYNLRNDIEDLISPLKNKYGQYDWFKPIEKELRNLFTQVLASSVSYQHATGDVKVEMKKETQLIYKQINALISICNIRSEKQI